MSGCPDEKWRVLDSETICETPWLRVDRESVATPSRPAGVQWLTAFRPLGAVVAPQLPDGRFLLIRQERISVRREMWEFPAGQVEGGGDEVSIVATAHRELGEEIGVVTREPLVSLGLFFSSCGFTNECCHLFLARNVETRDGVLCHDEKEVIHGARAFSAQELNTAISEGVVCDANTLATFARLSARGLLT